MDITIFPEKLHGIVNAVPSKSHAHRLLVCSAIADRPTTLQLSALCDDLSATIASVTGLGAKIEHRFASSEIVTPITSCPASAICPCGESGSTLRFMLPLAGALGVEAVFLLEGRLPYRPLSPLWEELERHGCRLRWLSRSELTARGIPVSRAVSAGLLLSGKLRAGHYRIDGDVSSQFISGLLMALPLLDGESRLELMGKIASRPYIAMTQQVLSDFGVTWLDGCTAANQTFHSPVQAAVEGDWSNAAFFLAANALGNHVEVRGLSDKSVQGDRAVTELLTRLRQNTTFSAADVPDLVPILAVVAAASCGCVMEDIARLRLKESDRLAAVTDMINALGGKAVADDDRLRIYPAPLVGGVVDAQNDHRIAMAAAIASTVCTRPVTILGAQCVRKSYPNFWKEFTRLGGKI